jgi:hypothetical protein
VAVTHAGVTQRGDHGHERAEVVHLLLDLLGDRSDGEVFERLERLGHRSGGVGELLVDFVRI